MLLYVNKVDNWVISYTDYLTKVEQGSYGSWKTWKVLEFSCGIFQDWRVLKKGD